MYLRIIFIMALIILCGVASGISEESDSIDFGTGNNIANIKETDDLMVTLNDDLLSLRARDVSVMKVIKEITKITGIECWVFGDSQKKITMEFKDIPFREGLNRILKNNSYMFSYNGDELGTLHIVKSKESPFSNRTGIAANAKLRGDVATTLEKLAKQGIQNFQKSIDTARLKSSLKNTQSNVSVEVTKQQFIDNISSNINLDELKKLTSVGLTK